MENVIFTTSINCLEWSLVYPVAMHFFWPHHLSCPKPWPAFPPGAYHCSDSPLFRRPIISTAHYSDGPFFRQCKIELNPQIHGLTRCIQQDGPSVRLILTDHGLDRMFWKGRWAFILGCTSPLKAIMIDRPGMGKVKNWRKSCAHCTKEPEKRSEGKKCETGEAWERQNDGR